MAGVIFAVSDLHLSKGYSGRKTGSTLPRANTPFPGRVIGDAARLLRGGRVNATAQDKLPELGNFWSVYGHIGAFYRAMLAEEAVWTIPRVGGIIDFWMPELAPLQRRNSCFRSNGAAAL